MFKQKTFSGGPDKAHSKNLELVKGLGGLSSETYFMERSKQNILYSNSHYSLFEVAKLHLEHFRKIAAIDTYIKDVSYILPICVSQFFPFSLLFSLYFYMTIKSSHSNSIASGKPQQTNICSKSIIETLEKLEISSKLTTTIQERHQWRRFDVFTANIFLTFSSDFIDDLEQVNVCWDLNT